MGRRHAASAAKRALACTRAPRTAITRGQAASRYPISREVEAIGLSDLAALLATA